MIKTMINKPKTHCFGIDCNVLYSGLALQQLKPGKALGPDFICPEHVLNAGSALTSWLYKFLSSCLQHFKLPKIWRRAAVVAIPKPKKPPGDPKSYRPISLLYVPFKIIERLIYTRVEPIVDPLLPQEYL